MLKGRDCFIGIKGEGCGNRAQLIDGHPSMNSAPHVGEKWKDNMRMPPAVPRESSQHHCRPAARCGCASYPRFSGAVTNPRPMRALIHSFGASRERSALCCRPLVAPEG